MNDSDLVIKGGTGEEVKKALDAYNSTVQVVRFLTEYRAVMGRSCVGMYDSSTLITEANNCFSTKVNHVKSKPLTKEVVL